MTNKLIPEQPQRVLLVNPTKYLGNLLIAGGLMQSWATYCQDQGIAFRIVLDDSYRELCENSFPPESLIYFPRRQINQANVFTKLSLYLNCLKQIRQFKADLAFNIEEDSASSNLTRMSGATFKLGCSPTKHQSGYDQVLNVKFENRKPGQEHRWHSFYEVFSMLGMTAPQQSYMALKLEGFPETLKTRLNKSGVDTDQPTIALHAGATKDYKKWPLQHMADLITLIQDNGLQPILIGAGNNDQAINKTIQDRLSEKPGNAQVVNLCDKLSIAELSQFLNTCVFMIGNDSGPFHLGSALGLPGLVLWGPTDRNIWGPLGEKSEILQGDFQCDAACSKGHCIHEYRCLFELTPQQVFSRMQSAIKEDQT